jgi:hypothetical protein
MKSSVYHFIASVQRRRCKCLQLLCDCFSIALQSLCDSAISFVRCSLTHNRYTIVALSLRNHCVRCAIAARSMRNRLHSDYDCAVIAQRMRSDCATIAQRLCVSEQRALLVLFVAHSHTIVAQSLLCRCVITVFDARSLSIRCAIAK